MLAHCLTLVPPLKQTLNRYMLETIGVQLVIASDHPPEALKVQVWTNAPTRFNGDGAWYAIDILLVGTPAAGHYRFAGELRPTSPGEFELTYRICHRDRPDQPQWLGHAHDNVRLEIAPPAPDMDWTQGPNHVEVMPGVFVGNFISASQAEALGFDGVLNMAEELDLAFPAEGAISYRKFSCRDGALHPIPEESLRGAIAWIDEQLAQGKQQILVHCRAGIGRSGSVGVAYCFYRNPHWSYQQALDYVWSQKPDVYPHQQLQASLEKLFPRRVEVDGEVETR